MKTCILCGREGTRQYMDLGMFGVPVCSNFGACDKRSDKRRQELIAEHGDEGFWLHTCEKRQRFNEHAPPGMAMPVILV